MSGVENYQRDPCEKMEKVLARCQWVRVGDGLWEKCESRLFVDGVGVFLYRLTSCHQWVRTNGRSHNLIVCRSRRITFDDMSTLNLSTGEVK